jgi:hypothetical protein
VGTAPWQLGTYVCYDLKKILALNGLQTDMTIATNADNIPADSFLKTTEYADFLLFRKNKMALLHHQPVDTAQVIHTNPLFYDAYRVAGDYSNEHKWYAAALQYYRQALQYEIATADERKSIERKILTARKQLKQPD